MWVDSQNQTAVKIGEIGEFQRPESKWITLSKWKKEAIEYIFHIPYIVV